MAGRVPPQEVGCPLWHRLREDVAGLGSLGYWVCVKNTDPSCPAGWQPLLSVRSLKPFVRTALARERPPNSCRWAQPAFTNSRPRNWPPVAPAMPIIGNPDARAVTMPGNGHNRPLNWSPSCSSYALRPATACVPPNSTAALVCRSIRPVCGASPSAADYSTMMFPSAAKVPVCAAGNATKSAPYGNSTLRPAIGSAPTSRTSRCSTCTMTAAACKPAPRSIRTIVTG